MLSCCLYIPPKSPRRALWQPPRRCLVWWEGISDWWPPWLRLGPAASSRPPALSTAGHRSRSATTPSAAGRPEPSRPSTSETQRNHTYIREIGWQYFD
eukprot:scaffold315715_cov28-Prasinocladus_malaysianus.AAC.1